MKKAKNIQHKKNIELCTFDEVFKKRTTAFERSYAEESLRLMLATQIKTARLEQHLTQSAIAKKAGMPQSIIARLESGEHGVSVDTLGKIAHALGKRIALA